MYPSLSTPPHSDPSRRRFSSAIRKLSLDKFRALVSPSSAPVHSHSPSIRYSQVPRDPSLSVSPRPCPTLHANSQTMKNYANQRSDKIPLREPAPFPTSLNFSQQTIYLFESNELDDRNHLNLYLNDLLHEPVQVDQPQTKNNNLSTKNKHCSFQFTRFHTTHLQTNRFNLGAIPISQGPTPIKTSLKPSRSSFLHPLQPSPSTTTHKAPLVDPKFIRRETDYSIEITSPVPELSKFYEHNRLLSLPNQLDAARPNDWPIQVEELPVPLEPIPEKSAVPEEYNRSSPTLSFGSQTALPSAESYQQEGICPRIDMVLTTSPFFNNSTPTLSPISTQEPGTPIGYSQATTGTLFQALTPYTLPGTETPSTCVNSVSADNRQVTPHGKFAMATGSPGIFNSSITLSSQPSSTPIRRSYSLLSPHHLPSPLPSKRSSHNPRGPGANMLATLEFLSDLCHKSPDSSEDNDSLLESDSLDDSIEPSVQPH